MEKLKKQDSLWVAILIVGMVMGYSLDVNLGTGDEIWNFHNVLKYYQGYTLYTDMNLIITPLFVLLGKGIFQLLGANLFVFRIYNILIYTALFLVIYSLLKQLLKDKKQAFLVLGILYFFLIQTIPGGANYNILAMLFYLFGVVYTLKNRGKSPFYWLVQGCIAFLIFLTKQNIGFWYVIGLCISNVVLYQTNKKRIVECVKQLFVLGFFILIFLFGLWCCGNLFSFIDYAVLGLQEFGMHNLIGEVDQIFFGVCIILIIGSIICFLHYNKNIKLLEEEKVKIDLLLGFGVPSLMIMVPISNQYHVKIACLIFVILFVYILSILFKELKISSKIMIITNITLVLLSIGASLAFTIQWIEKIMDQTYPYNYSEPFWGGIISEKIEKMQGELVQYREKNTKEVIIFSPDAALFNIPTGLNYGAMDLPFMGNMGYHGEERMLHTIQNLKNSLILLRKEKPHYQESKKIRNYIENHYSRIGEIGIFYIYETN